MKNRQLIRRQRLSFLVVAGVFAVTGCGADTSTPSDSISESSSVATAGVLRHERLELATLEDKIRGGWAGQMIGVSYGAPTEFRYLSRVIPEDELPEWTPDRVSNSINQDDLYVEMTFFAVLDEKGWEATTDDFGAAFRDSKYSLWHANYAARRALRRGVPATESGTPAVNPHANDIDFQIEADFVGLLAPGMPKTAVDLAERVGRVMNGGDGILGGVFVGGLYSAAFFEDDPRKIVEAGLLLLPADSLYARIIADTLLWSAENPDDWLVTWQLIEDHYGGRDVCPQGAGVPFNIDAHLNGSYIALGLLYGGGEFEKTLIISTRAGQDSDCNPASAVGVLGVVLGFERIPEKYKSGIDDIADEKFAFTNYSFEDIVKRNLARAIDAAVRNGGSMIDGSINVPIQAPVRAEVTLFDDYGRVKERIKPNDARVKLTGNWEMNSITPSRNFEWIFADAEEAGAEAEVEFTGTGVILTAAHRPDAGTVEVWLDGESQGVWDTYSEEDPANRWSTKLDEAVWHQFGLTDGAHTLRVQVLGQPYTRTDVTSGGTIFSMMDIVVFHQEPAR
ncbi:MAG: ADP-ribosylglycohydrolase family protein [Gammaproteobacteria bacterium]|nr:ADP-ribosylglycohydrolase family protein [Gammaproteobacteria bacterium]